MGFGGFAKPLDRGRSEAERIFIINGFSFVMIIQRTSSFCTNYHDKCQGHEKPSQSLHIAYVMHFKLVVIVGLTSTDRYFLRKIDIERSQTGVKPLVRSQGRSPLKLNVLL